MSAAKKKPRAPRPSAAKRPPRIVWAIVDGDGVLDGTFTTKANALAARVSLNDCVVGPYVLAERVGER